jgi:clathrin heavy chain
MTKKQKFFNCVVDDVVKHWSWVDKMTLGLVGVSGIWHISLGNLSKPVEGTVNAELIYRREASSLGQTQVIGYGYAPTKTFCANVELYKSNDQVKGQIQLRSFKFNKTQPVDGYAFCFTQMRVRKDIPSDSMLFMYASKDGLNGNLTISELDATSNKYKNQIAMSYPSGSEMDFPIHVHCNANLGLVFIFTKMGLLFLIDVLSGATILRSKLGDQQLMSVCENKLTNGLILVSRQGNVMTVDIDDEPLVSYVRDSKSMPDLAQKLSIKCGLQGSEQIYNQKFNDLVSKGMYKEAAQLAAKSPKEILRNRNTIDKLKNAPKPANGPHPILQFFFVLLETGQLKEVETLELCKLVIQQNKKNMVQNWIDQDKICVNEALGDLLVSVDKTMAELVYEICESPKAIMLKMERGEVDSSLTNQSPEVLLQQIKNQLLVNPNAAVQFAINLTKMNRIHWGSTVEIFRQAQHINELTAYCMECLPDSAECSTWQTLVLETNLKMNPTLAETIFQSNKFSHYNKSRLGMLCEQKGLYHRALENFTDLKDIKRVLVNNSSHIQPEFMVSYMTNTLPSEHVPVVLTDLLKFNRGNMQFVVGLAKQLTTKVEPLKLVEIFENLGMYEGVFMLLKPILENIIDPATHLKFVEAAIKCRMFGDLETFIKNYNGKYDPEKVMQTMIDNKIQDPKSLVILCDQNNYIKPMVRYLWENNFNKYIEMYVIRINPKKSGEVLGCLLDLGAEDSYIRQFLLTVGGNCDVAEMVSEFEERNKLKLLEQWLEGRAMEGNIKPEVHNALAKLAIDFDKEPSKFLAENNFYDIKKIGKYAENRDPHLALIAYKRDMSSCDHEIIELTNKQGLYRFQAKYLIERKSEQLWEYVLMNEENAQHKQYVVEQVASSALSESTDVEEVSTTVQAFITAQMPEELLGLLENIVLHSREFSGYKKLQNLLLITAIKTKQEKVMDYINKLDNYDELSIAEVACKEEFGLYEEAFTIYKKIDRHIEATNILLDKLDSVERAAEYADRVGLPELHSLLAGKYLDQKKLLFAIESFQKANDSSRFMEVIGLNRELSEREDEKLIKYLDMARSVKKEREIDNEYIYCLARLNMLPELEQFLNSFNSADISSTGDRLFSEQYYEAAKLLYIKLKSNSKIASCLLKLNDFPQAVEYAKKANNVKTWKSILYTCVIEKEFKLAYEAGQNLVVIPDHLEETVFLYELYDASNEIIYLLEQLVRNEKSHLAIFTELALLYAKYREEKLFDFIKVYNSKLNIVKMEKVCQTYHLWREVVYLHSNYNEFDKCVKVMIEHSPECYNHDTFVTYLLKVTNTDLLYRAIHFYLEEEPSRLNDLLTQISTKIDLTKTVNLLKKEGFLWMAEDWLRSVQAHNNQAVNDALNSLYLESYNYESLKDSILKFDSIDSLSLAKNIEGIDNPEFRRISILIYRKNNKFADSIKICLDEGLYMDAVETAAESNDRKIVEALLKKFAKDKRGEWFTICCYYCYNQLRPDVVMELAWTYDLKDFGMPFFIQLFSDISTNIESVQKKHEERERKEEENKEKEANRPIDIGVMGGPMINSLGGNLMLTDNAFQGMGDQPDYSALGGNNNRGGGTIGSSFGGGNSFGGMNNTGGANNHFGF